MKRVIIALIMLLFAISVSLLSEYFLDKKITVLSTTVESLSVNSDEEKIKAVLSDWQSIKAFLKFVTVHEIVNELEIHFEELTQTTNNKEKINEICSQIKTLLTILKKSEEASAENIF